MKLMEVCDGPICQLGEGIFWHPERHSFCWFDILNSKFYEQTDDQSVKVIDCPGMASAAARIDTNRLLVAVEDGLHILDLESKSWESYLEIESENSLTRSNDCRVHPSGSFWFGTMAHNAERGAGSIYHVRSGKIQLLYSSVTIPNSICFTPDGSTAYFADSALNLVWRVELNPQTGLPLSERHVFISFEPNIIPDGAIVDSQGNVWIALWGASKVAAYRPDGSLLTELHASASQVSCPAFGGANCTELRVTSAWANLDETSKSSQPDAGCVFKFASAHVGQIEAIYKL